MACPNELSKGGFSDLEIGSHKSRGSVQILPDYDALRIEESSLYREKNKGRRAQGFRLSGFYILALLTIVTSLCQLSSAVPAPDVKEKILTGAETLGGGAMPDENGSFGNDAAGNVMGALGRTLHNAHPEFNVPGRGVAGALVNNPVAKKIMGKGAADGVPGANFAASYWGVDVPQDQCKWEEIESDAAVHGKCFWAPKGCNCNKYAPEVCNTREKGAIFGFRETMNVCCERDDNQWCRHNRGIGRW